MLKHYITLKENWTKLEIPALMFKLKCKIKKLLVFSSFWQETEPGKSCQFLAPPGRNIFFQLFPAFERI